MRRALAATLVHPAWWAMALAGFLVRGGVVVIALPIVSLPTTASLITTFAPALEALVLGRPSLEGVIAGAIIVVAIVGGLLLAALVGSWLDLALLREAAEDEELDLGWRPAALSAARGLGIRLLAHIPTFLALGYGAARIVGATYDELIAPGDVTVPVAVRVALRMPDAVALLLATWLLGETVGPLAVRLRSAGLPLGAALARAVRRVGSVRGVLTLVAANLPLVAVAVAFTAAVGGAWLHVMEYLYRDVGAVFLAAALLLLTASWVLGLAVLGATLAWRATAWTCEVAPRRRPEADPMESEATEGQATSSVT